MTGCNYFNKPIAQVVSCVCKYACVYICMYVCTCACMCLHVERLAFLTKYNKLQLFRPAARMETNIHTYTYNIFVGTYNGIEKKKTEIMGWKHH